MSESDKPGYAAIVRHYEAMLSQHHSGPLAVDWKNTHDAGVRYDVMLGLLGTGRAPVSLLDFGCGLGELKKHIDARGLDHIRYEGLEISRRFADAARERLPGVPIHCMDVLAPGIGLEEFDYVVMNGIFTRRQSLTHAQMLDYLERLVAKVFAAARRGLAFNVMSPCVDWKGEALFHPTFDEIVAIVERTLSRHFVLRNDYGLYEFTCYVYREPWGSTTHSSSRP